MALTDLQIQLIECIQKYSNNNDSEFSEEERDLIFNEFIRIYSKENYTPTNDDFREQLKLLKKYIVLYKDFADFQTNFMEGRLIRDTQKTYQDYNRQIYFKIIPTELLHFSANDYKKKVESWHQKSNSYQIHNNGNLAINSQNIQQQIINNNTEIIIEKFIEAVNKQNIPEEKKIP